MRIAETMRLHELVPIDENVFEIEWYGFSLYKIEGVYRSNIVGDFADFETKIVIGDREHILRCNYDWFWKKYTEFIDLTHIKVGLGNITLN